LPRLEQHFHHHGPDVAVMTGNEYFHSDFRISLEHSIRKDIANSIEMNTHQRRAERCEVNLIGDLFPANPAGDELARAPWPARNERWRTFSQSNPVVVGIFGPGEALARNESR